jgi:hypothetical protein
MISEAGSIQQSRSSGSPRLIRTKKMIELVKNRSKRKKKGSIRKLATELDLSNAPVHRIVRNDLGSHAYKKRIEPLRTDTQRVKRMQFAKGFGIIFEKIIF